MRFITAAVGLWLPVVVVLASSAAVLGAVLVLVQWVTAHQRPHFWCRRWAHAALPGQQADPDGQFCAEVLTVHEDINTTISAVRSLMAPS